MTRPSGRIFSQLRDVTITPHVSMHAGGSCEISMGNTKLICTASVDESVPRFLKGSKSGWVTAEYGMLPASTNSRMRREAKTGKQTGRTQEIQRLIGRSLRMAVDLSALGERQITVDCDVIQADGGTRTAAITGGYVALKMALQGLLKERVIRSLPLTDEVAAISCGIYRNQVVVDLDYAEDSEAMVDANFVMTAKGRLIETQATGEGRAFTQDELLEMMDLSKQATELLFEKQRHVFVDA